MVKARTKRSTIKHRLHEAMRKHRAEVEEEEAPPPRPSRQRHHNAPDYVLKVYDGDYSSRIGAAWVKGSSGGISIKLDRCVVLDARDFSPAGDLLLTLWPNDGDLVFGSGD